jgi:putative intracellular protease/amidase
MRDRLDALDDRLESPVPLEDVSAGDFDGVFIPGGHGPMEDLAVSPELGRLLVAMVDDGRVVAAVCHGPAALLSATRPDGTWAFEGRSLTGFSNEEETQAGLADDVQWLVEDRLREQGGDVTSGPAWRPYTVVDGDVVTGQNPASSADTAKRTVERLDARAHRIHLVPHEGGWTFKHEGGEPEGQFKTKREAEAAAKEHARQHGDREVVIHDRHGRISDWSKVGAAQEAAKPEHVH